MSFLACLVSNHAPCGTIPNMKSENTILSNDFTYNSIRSRISSIVIRFGSDIGDFAVSGSKRVPAVATRTFALVIHSLAEGVSQQTLEVYVQIVPTVALSTNVIDHFRAEWIPRWRRDSRGHHASPITQKRVPTVATRTFALVIHSLAEGVSQQTLEVYVQIVPTVATRTFALVIHSLAEGVSQQTLEVYAQIVPTIATETCSSVGIEGFA